MSAGRSIPCPLPNKPSPGPAHSAKRVIFVSDMYLPKSLL